MAIIHAHRGASAYAPQNTLPAFELAVKLGADAIECDIHMTADGYVVVSHNFDIDTESTGHGFIRDMTLNELKKYDFGIKFGEKFKGTTIPTLDEMLDVVKDLELINIEIKANSVGIIDKTVNILKSRKLIEKTIISSFDPEVLRDIKKVHPSLRTGILYGEFNQSPHIYAKELKADAIHPHEHAVNKEIVEICLENNIEVNIWTPNTPESIERAINLGSTGILTDYPDVALSLLNRAK